MLKNIYYKTTDIHVRGENKETVVYKVENDIIYKIAKFKWSTASTPGEINEIFDVCVKQKVIPEKYYNSRYFIQSKACKYFKFINLDDIDTYNTYLLKLNKNN